MSCLECIPIYARVLFPANRAFELLNGPPKSVCNGLLSHRCTGTTGWVRTADGQCITVCRVTTEIDSLMVYPVDARKEGPEVILPRLYEYRYAYTRTRTRGTFRMNSNIATSRQMDILSHAYGKVSENRAGKEYRTVSLSNQSKE
ncbi:MAG: hypothetical protein CVV34_02910 [Methanomicrobiales archaeon HGW-Methanomicrobiales-5]|nr:MAG: hypothetical protein CVV34_02910 [Methanomicrobiales archaeon HGW-Methanomicrobiales-5]